jgi:hypothetical protein
MNDAMPTTSTLSEPSRTFPLMRLHVATAHRADYTLEATAALVGLHPELLQHYCRLGLFGEALARPDCALRFDDEVVFQVRRYEYYRRHHGIERRTLRLLCALWREVDQLKLELHFIRIR